MFRSGICILLIISALLLATEAVGAQAAISLATDKQSYAPGDTVVFFGRGYGFPNAPTSFYIYIDEITSNGHIRSILYANFTAEPPNWDFTIFWSPQTTGTYTAYVTGPDHTASLEVQFQVSNQLPIPEFPTAIEGLLIVLVLASCLAIAVSRRQGREE